VRASAQAAVTPVSHASIFTGQNPYTHGLRVMHGRTRNRLEDGAVTLAEVLSVAGYRTAAFTSAFPVTERFGLAQGFDHFDQAFLDTPEAQPEDGPVNTGTNQRRGDATTDAALDWLNAEVERVQPTAGSAPRFVWVHYFDPHDVFVLPPDEFVARHPAVPPAERAQLRALYAIEVQYMDQQIGRLLEAFESSSADEPLVAVVADHGEGHGDHGWWTHGLLYEEQVRVPMILRIPGVGEGARVESRVRTIDLAPTLFDGAGIAPADWPPMEGRSLLPLMRGESLPSEPAYADSLSLMTYHFTRRVVDRKNDMLFAVTDGGDGPERWKYIFHALRPQDSELYELTSDPGETRNRIGDAPEALARMRSLLGGGDLVPDELPMLEQMDPRDAERLRALGYGP